MLPAMVTDARLHLYSLMQIVSLSVKHVASNREQPCGACGAPFVPAEDSGSRVLSIKPSDEPAFGVLLCGGCHSKWTHGATVSLRQAAPRE